MPLILISDDEQAALPIDNDPMAFAMFERTCRDQMTRVLGRYGINDDASEVWFEYMAQVRAAALAYGVDAMLDAPLPSFKVEDFQAFYAKAVETTLVMGLQGRRDRAAQSVPLGVAAKARLQKCADSLAAEIDGSDLPDARKEALRAKLREFRAELEGDRASMPKMLSALAIITAALSAPVVLVGKAEDDIIKLPKAVAATQQVLAIIGQAKSEELDRAPPPITLPKREQPKAIEGPKENMEDVDLDDEIPF